MFDDNLNRRKVALKYILEARVVRERDNQLRQFILPGNNLNFEAPRYFDLVLFNRFSQVTDPPMLFNFSNEQLQACANGAELNLPAVPLHSQNNEFWVSRVSQAASVHHSYEKQQQQILLASSNRQKHPLDAPKSTFV